MAATLASRIDFYVEDWRPILGLSDWRIVVQIDNSSKEQGYCIAQPQYEDAVIGFNLKRIRKAKMSLEDLEAFVVHELVHCVIWKSSERATTQIERALLRARYPKSKWALFHG